jgi:ribosomal protein S27E
MADPSPAQRHYRAPCPGCGAPVEFRSAQSTHAVCGYCQSTVVRQGEVLSRLGKMAELFDDHSLLQLMASGTLDGQGFTLVGRLQYTYGEGSWTEWQALLNDGSTGSLSEDNGAYVFSRPVAPGRDLPAADQFRVGATTAINGQKYSVASNEMVALRSAQGELPRLPALGQPFAMVELRGQDSAQVLSIDFGPTLAGAPPAVSLGRPVTLDELQMSGLKDQSAKDEKGRQFNCPNCGATVEVALAQSKSITCKSCNSLIDLSAGIGGELRHAEQHEPMRPLIPLGTLGQLEGVVWQVVGFQHRMGQEPGDDEQFGWEEYLLYNAKRGFSFLVDATDGWSLVRPVTGAPLLAANGQSATWQGTTYRQQYAYKAETTYVAGEFYWQVQRGQKTDNRDFASGKQLLSMEQSRNEITWSSGRKIESATVASAFKLEGQKDLLKRDDAAPFTAARSVGIIPLIVMLVAILMVLSLLSRCSRCDPRVENCSSSSARTSGGSYGGSSSGGGHK